MSDKFLVIGKELGEFSMYENPVQIAWHKIMLAAGYSPASKIHEFGAICAAHPWFHEQNKNPYHNAVHTAQVMWSGFLLTQKSMLEHDKSWFPKFMLALMFHDVGHNGQTNKFKYQLELLATHKFEEYVYSTQGLKALWDNYLSIENGSCKEMVEFVKQIILATEVTEDVPRNISVYESKKEHTLMEVLVVLAQEADVMPSVMPLVGWKNSELLAKEWDNPAVATEQGRVNFLKSVKYVSYGSKNLGVQDYINSEIKKLEEKISLETKV